MKAGWATKTIEDVCSVMNGGTPKTGVSEYWDGAHQWITPAEMGKRSTPYVAKTERTITDAGMQNSSARLLPPLSVILSSRAPIGHLVINTEPMATNQGCKGLVPSDDLNHKYLYYYLSSIVQLLNDLGTGATFKELSGGKLKEVPIPLPPLPEQQRIVAILDEAFAAIAAARANAEKNRQNARALFESYLQSVFSQRGEGWVEKTLGDLCDLYQGLCINAKTKHLLVESSNLPLLRIKDLRDNSSEQYVAEVGWPKNAFVTESEIIYTRTGQIGLVFRGRRGVLHNNCFKVTPSNELNGDYLFWWLQNPTFRARITTLASKAAQPDISHALFKIQPICLPPRSYQDQAIPLINQVHEETQRLESLYQRKIAALDELKQSLLQQAFSGNL